MDKVRVYFNYLAFKLVNGFLYSLSILFFVEDQSVSTLIAIIILQEFYFSYFFTAKKNQVISRGKAFPIYYYLVTSAVVFCCFMVVTYHDLPHEVHAIVLLNLLFYTFYAWHAPLNEARDVTHWVSLENKASFVSVLLIFFTLFIAHFTDTNFDNVILLRLGFVYLCMNLYFFVRLNFSEVTVSRGPLTFFKTMDVIFILMMVKMLFFDVSLKNDKIDGYGIKVFFVAYDFVAALIGLYLRRTIALHSANFNQVNNATYKVNGIIALLTILSVLYSNFLGDNFVAAVSTIVFVSIAVNYNYFTFENPSKTWIIKCLYIIIALTVYFTKDFQYMLLIPFLHYVFSLYCCKTRQAE